jgi:excinuclease UvrABC nuclease subunit
VSINHSLAFDPAGDVEAFAKALPAKWCVYSLHDGEGKPVQVLCVKNLRTSVKNRLLPEASELPSKRVDLSAIVREVRWRRVTSNFEMDLVYLQAVREHFPQHWRGLVAGREPSFVRVDASEKFPRFVQVPTPTASGRNFGPFADNGKSNKFIELAQDAFDLCRYHNILVQAPKGRACAYKDIGRCDAPCDGSQTMENYRARVQLAADQLGDVSKAIDADTVAMKSAAANLDFEAAGRLKRRVDALSKLSSGAGKHAGDAKDFCYAVLQPAGVKHAAKLYFVDIGRIVEVVGLFEANDIAVGMLHELCETPFAGELDTYQLELILRHQPAAKGGVWIPMRDFNMPALKAAMKKILKQADASEVEADEGLLKESPSGVT